MMLALLLAARLASAGESPDRAALLQAFRAFCFTPAAKAGALGAPAVAAGFKPTPLITNNLGWDETAAWQRRGLRLFRMTAPADRQSRPMCGVTANINSLGADDALVASVIALTGSAFGEGHGERGVSGWMLAQRRGSVRIDIDRTSAPDARVTLIAYPRLR